MRVGDRSDAEAPDKPPPAGVAPWVLQSMKRIRTASRFKAFPWWKRRESNPRPSDDESDALPAELLSVLRSPIVRPTHAVRWLALARRTGVRTDTAVRRRGCFEPCQRGFQNLSAGRQTTKNPGRLAADRGLVFPLGRSPRADLPSLYSRQVRIESIVGAQRCAAGIGRPTMDERLKVRWVMFMGSGL